MKRIITAISLAFVLSLASGCGEAFDPFAFMNPEFDEGLNIHDIEGTITVPAAYTSSVGAIYIGLYSGVEDGGGYPIPVTAPGTGDAFPYGGTSIGTFEGRDNSTGLRDPDLGCTVVNNRQFYPADDGSGDLKHDFLIRQFPFYNGTVVYAFADNDFGTCDPTGGYEDPGTDLDSDLDDVQYPSNYPDILNYPQDYVTADDLVTDAGTMTLTTVDTYIELTLDCRVDSVNGC